MIIMMIILIYTNNVLFLNIVLIPYLKTYSRKSRNSRNSRKSRIRQNLSRIRQNTAEKIAEKIAEKQNLRILDV